MEREKITMQETEDASLNGSSVLAFLRIVESMVTRTANGASAAFQLILKLARLEPELFDSAYRAELDCRSLAGRVSALTELYCDKDTIGAMRVASYDLRQFFSVLTEQINRALGHKLKGDVTFEMDEESEPGVSCDARRVSMILYHLVANALQHGRTENKNVKIHCCVKQRVFTMSVRDYGGGIPKEKMKTLFSGFTEALSLQSLQEGAFPPNIRGLGLPLCKKLTEDMQGELQVKSYKTGVKVTLVLPQSSACFRENSYFLPDDTLLRTCMADLLASCKPERNEIESMEG